MAPHDARIHLRHRAAGAPSTPGERHEREPTRPPYRHWSFVRSAALPLATATLAGAIFVLDTVTDYEIAAATFYVVVVLLSVRFCRIGGVIMVSAGCVVLTILSYALTNDGNFRVGIVNTSISLLAIAATTYLAMKMESARARAEQAQARLAHVARVTTLGELSASIAHEVNQPLAGVVANASACSRWLRAEPPNMERAIASIATIVEDANRASEIIARVRALTKPADPQRSWLDVNDAIREAAAIMQSRIRESRVSLRTQLSGGLPMVFADRIQLQQVVLNLLVNSLDAVEAGGSGAREIRIGSVASQSNDVTVTVEDTGVGLDPAAVSRVFDAFHSTKPDGMGMGLSICRSIVEAHGGRIRALPNAAGGATFEFTLPGERRGMQ